MLDMDWAWKCSGSTVEKQRLGSATRNRGHCVLLYALFQATEFINTIILQKNLHIVT